MTTSKSIGSHYETIAAKYLQKKGLTEIVKNYHCKRGEIDLIMKHGSTLVFIEVRFRRKNNFGSAEESITYHKQKKIISTASHFLSQKNLWDTPCRFDAVTIKPKLHPLKGHEINWIISAFN
jgi:putative endonuclease